MSRIKPGQKVRVGIETQDGQILQFFCYVREVLSDRLTLMFSETKKIFARYLYEGTTIRLSIYTSGGIMLLKSIVLTEPADCEFAVEYDTSYMKRIQRRKYVRARANYRMIIEQLGQTFTVLTEDIGGGGVRFVSDNALQFSEVSAKLFIPEIETGLPFEGVISQKERYRNNEYLIQFTQISDEVRNKIIQKCLDIESKSIRES